MFIIWNEGTKHFACLAAAFEIAMGSCSLELWNIMPIAKEGGVVGGEIYCRQ